MRTFKSSLRFIVSLIVYMAACYLVKAQSPVVPISTDPDPIVMTAASCLGTADQSATISSGTLNLQIVDGSGNPVPVGTGTSMQATIGAVTRTITSGSVSSISIPNPAKTTLSPYFLSISVLDKVSNRLTKYPKVQVMLNDLAVAGRFTQFNFCKANTALATNVPVTYVVGPAGPQGTSSITGMTGDGAGNAALTGKFSMSDVITSTTPYIDLRFWGASDSSSANVAANTTAIQGAINIGATLGSPIYVPPSGNGNCYKFTQLYAYYDASLNPTYPVTSGQSVPTTIFGAGSISNQVQMSSPVGSPRSILCSTATTGDAIKIGNGTSFVSSAFKMHDLTIKGATTGWLTSINRVTSQNELKNVTFWQTGNGNGVKIWDAWNHTHVDNVQVYHTSSTGSYASPVTGTAGIQLCNNTGAQDNVGIGIGAFSFDIGILIGGRTADTDCISQIDAITLIDPDAESNNIGIYVGRAAFSVTLTSPHTESNFNAGIYQSKYATNISYTGGVQGDQYATLANFYAEAGTSGFAPIFTVRNWSIVAVCNYGFLIDGASGSTEYGGLIEDSSISTNNPNLANCSGATRNSSGTVVWSGTAGANIGVQVPPQDGAWRIKNVNFSVGTPIVNWRYLAEYRAFQSQSTQFKSIESRIAGTDPLNYDRLQITGSNITTNSVGTGGGGSAPIVIQAQGPLYFGGNAVSFESTSNSLFCNFGDGACSMGLSASNRLNYVYSKNYLQALRTPSSSSAACTAGEFGDDANFHYVCAATNTWKRVAIATW